MENTTLITTLFWDKLTREGRYPVRDFVPDTGLTHVNGSPARKGIAGKWTGDYRPPRAGEYYISGAIPEVYRAPNDLITPYHIARLVRIAVETRYQITESPL